MSLSRLAREALLADLPHWNLTDPLMPHPNSPPWIKPPRYEEPTPMPRDDLPPPNAVQVGGSHYKHRGIEPWDIIEAWDLDFFEGNAIKYILRHKPDTPRTLDLQKAIHYLEKCLERAFADASANPADVSATRATPTDRTLP